MQLPLVQFRSSAFPLFPPALCSRESYIACDKCDECHDNFYWNIHAISNNPVNVNIVNIIAHRIHIVIRF